MARRKRPQVRDAKGRFTRATPDPLAILQGWRPYERRLPLVPSTAEHVLELIKPPRVVHLDDV